MMFRKGLSGIVVTVLMVALSLTAVGLFSVYLNTLTGEEEFSPAFSCLEMQLDPTIRLERACYNEETGDVELRVFRSDDNLNLKNIYFILNGEGDSKRLCCGEDCDSCDILESGGSKDYYFSTDGSEESVILSVLNCGVNQVDIGTC